MQQWVKFTHHLVLQTPVYLTSASTAIFLFNPKNKYISPTPFAMCLAFWTLELRAIFQVTSSVKVFHYSLFRIHLPEKLFCMFQDAKPFLLLLFQVCYWHLQAPTGAFSQLPPKTPIVPRRLTFPLGHQLKSITFIPIVLAVIGALALCQVELVGFLSPFLYYWNFAKNNKSESSKIYVYTLGTTTSF